MNPTTISTHPVQAASRPVHNQLHRVPRFTRKQENLQNNSYVHAIISIHVDNVR